MRHWTYRGEKRRLKVLRRDNWECQIRLDGCLGVANTVDHIHAKAWGGTEDESNLRAACGPCNKRKGVRSDAQRPRSFFSGGSSRRAPLLKIPPRSRWGAVVSDYSRSEGDR